MTENEIGREVVDSALKIHLTLGPGLFESVYEVVLAHELTRRGLRVERQKVIPIIYEGIEFEEGFRADLIVNGLVIVEIKSVENLSNAHRKQVLTYLRLTGLKLGFLISFAEALLKDGLQRFVNRLEEPGSGSAGHGENARD